MTVNGMVSRARFIFVQLQERLWVKPLMVGLLSIAAALAASKADSYTRLATVLPRVSAESVESLLSIMASSMLVIATFAVASMVSAYASASTTASPRSFALVIADDISQRALSTFIGAFIFSIVGLTAAKNGFFGGAGIFVLFLFTAFVFGLVILTFVYWVDRIARLGRLGNTVDQVEEATVNALGQRRIAPTLCAVQDDPENDSGVAVTAESAGYVQRIDVASLQEFAEQIDGKVRVVVLPGSFVSPERVLAYVMADSDAKDWEPHVVASAFVIDKQRTYYEDPRYGLVVLSQIAARALSPAVNDPGTAIDVCGTLVRLFLFWSAPLDEGETAEILYDRIMVPELSVEDMFDDAFIAIERDGCASLEVAIRVQKAMATLAAAGHAAMRQAALRHSARALVYARKGLLLDEDVAAVQALAVAETADTEKG
ncbi:hypothetical protein TspCOW1_06490 [Thiohalobacter sp. COW1]|nr:hypothetical protein TspCOW1_06490 [Thiohalobacter sp. COW1]